VREREKERVCVCVRERECVCVCVCERERERKRENGEKSFKTFLKKFFFTLKQHCLPLLFKCQR
jgi:hypothetical protein